MIKSARSISVVIPAYNAEAFIHKALDSVLAQTVPVNEIIVVDDGSQDRTRDIVAAYGSRMQLLSQHNQGPSEARNFGVRVATSDLIGFLDADDAWRPNKIEKQLAALVAEPDSLLCYTGLYKVHNDGSGEIHAATPSQSLGKVLRTCNPGITPSSVLLSREAFIRSGGFTDGLKGSEDWDLWLRLIELGPFCAVDEPLTVYQVSNTGLSSNADWMLKEAMSMLEDRLLAGYSGISRLLWRRRIVSLQLYKAAMTARACDEHFKALRYLYESALLWPSPFWHPVRFVSLGISLLHAIRTRRYHTDGRDGTSL